MSAYLGVPVQIEKVDIRWFNRLILEGIYLEDQQGNVLFEANHIAAGFEVLPLLKKKFVFTTVRLFSFSLNLSKETPQDELNLQFLIDAFASKDSIKKETDIDLRFNSILIRRGQLSYHVLSADSIKGKFDPNHINVNNLSAKISLKAFNKDTLNANIKKMSFEEASGFNLDKLSMNVISNKDSAFIQNFQIRLPETDLRIENAHINFTQTDSLHHLVNTAPVRMDIAPSKVCLRDLAPFVPAFSNFRDIIDISAEAEGYINDISLKRLTLEYSDKMLFIGKMDLRGITNPEEAYVFGQVNRMYLTTEGLTGLLNNFNEQEKELPEEVKRLGTINFTGEISGFFDHLVAYGKVSTAIGSVETDILFGSDKEKDIAMYVSGTVSTSQIELHELFPEGNPYGIARLNLKINARRPVNGYFSGNVTANILEFDFKEYRHENIQLSGRFSRNSFNGKVQIDDPNGKLYAEGMFLNQGRNSIFNFTADLQNFRPDKMNLFHTYESPDLSFKLTADFQGNNIDNVEGIVHLDSLVFHTEPSSFSLEHFDITASGYANNRKLTISSDFLNGEVKGAYSFTTFVPSIMNTLKGYVPALINATTRQSHINENNFSLLLEIENTEAISQTLKLPVTIVEKATVMANYDNFENKFRLDAYLPEFRIGKSTFTDGFITGENPFDLAEIEVKATQYNAKGLRNYISLKAEAANNQLNTLISWANNKDNLFKADFSASTQFIEDTDIHGKPSLRTEITINESPVVISDSLWTIDEAAITLQNGKIDIDNFSINHKGQHILLDGIISADPSDTLLLDLNQIELSYIFEVLNIPVLQFGGEATGIFHITDLFGSRILNTPDLEVQNFSFNQVELGRLNLYSEWDDNQQGILLLGSIYKNDTTWTDVNGYIFPVGERAGLTLFFDANDIDIAFLQPFLANVATDIKGRGFGNVHLHGPFHSLTIEGDAFVKEGGLGIEFLDTYYTFSDSLHMYPGSFSANNLMVYDKHGNWGRVNLTVNHNHFKDVEFDVDIQANNMLVYDVPERKNPLIYGTVFGSGSATIKGNEKVIDFDINMRTEKNTSVSMNFMSGSRAAEYDFITFVDKSNWNKAEEDTLKRDSLRVPPIILNNETAELRMNFLLDITPDATIELIMDPIAGDKIRGYGSGNIQVEWGTKNDLRMYGGYDILSGTYNFSLQQLIHKLFRIREGSSVTFQGDPYYALLDIDAIYNVTANISDLDQDLVEQNVRTSIPVNCVLKLDGMLQNPTISFDLEFPGTGEDLVQKIKSYIDTEDMLTRQIVYLLVLNKFYTLDYTNSVRTNEFSAVASSAISSQISSILNTITDKVQIGTNIRTNQDGLNDTEFEMLLSSQLLDNRLIFNGNFGYRNNHERGSVFVGEFDIEYMLTRSGEIRLKAYNHSNENTYYLKNNSLTTQGLGIMYKKDFTHISEIFRRRRRILFPPTDTTPINPIEETEDELLFLLDAID